MSSTRARSRTAQRQHARRRHHAPATIAIALCCATAGMLAVAPDAAAAQTVGATAAPASPHPGATPIVVVLPFEFAAPVPESRGFGPVPPPYQRPGLGGWPGRVGPPLALPARESRVPRRPPSRPDVTDAGSAVGTGVADLLVERLVAAGGFRVLDRRWLDAHRAGPSTADSVRAHREPVEWPRYTIEGSVTRFGVEEGHALGGLGTLARLGGLGLRRPKTTVTLVARLVDARTGEVVATARGEGRSRRGAGVTLGGIMNGGGGIFSVGSKSFRESALGEATDRAVGDLARQIVERRSRLSERD